MIKKILTMLVLTAALLGGFSPSVQAQATPEEAIIFFNSDIGVNADNSVDVIETIVYESGPYDRHGIYRDIRAYSSQDRKMEIQNVTVTNESGEPYMYELSGNGGDFKIKIGDPDTTFKGRKTYVIQYRATKAVAQFDTFDEIYWNVTGTEWEMPIYQTRASVTLPAGAVPSQASCYYGPKGSTDQCPPAGVSGSTYVFNAPSALAKNENMTVAVGFQKGIAAPYTAADNASRFFHTYVPWIIAGLLPLLTLALSLLHWHRKGRDARGTGVIVPQYDVPDGLTPMEVVGIAQQGVSTKHISAEIIYLATKGYLKIRQLEEHLAASKKKPDFELTRLKDPADLPNEFDKKLLYSLFGERPNISGLSLSDAMSLLTRKKKNAAEAPAQLSETVKLSDLEYQFFNDASAVVTMVLDALVSKGYYKNIGRMKNFSGRLAVLIFMSIWAPLFFGAFIGHFLFDGNILPIALGIFIAIVVYGIVSYFSPSKTESGMRAKEYILGLKDYLQIAEKDRLKFHNAPEKKPELFEKLLPYAMVLGVVDIWAKEFEGLNNIQPSWYSDSSGGAFSAAAFGNSMSSFSSSAGNSLTSSPAGSGSGGGGSSGGGGGGGGGGGW